MTIQSDRQPSLQFDPISGRVNDAGDSKNVRLYGAIHHGLSIADHIAWLTRVDNSRNNQPFFYHQPWEHIRKLYRDIGDMEAVREINWAYDKAKARFAVQTAKRWQRPILFIWNGLLDRLMGHGHKLFRVVPWIGVTMVLFLIWAGVAYHVGSIVPTNARVYMNPCYLHPQTTCDGWTQETRGDRLVQMPSGYPAFDPILYTLDTFIPFADLHQERYWTVTDNGPWGQSARVIFSVFIAFGGVLSAIFAAAMLSLIRKG